MTEKQLVEANGYWRQEIAAFNASGVTLRQWCREHGYSVWRFYYWRSKLRHCAEVAPASAFTELKLTGDAEPRPVLETVARLELHFSCGNISTSYWALGAVRVMRTCGMMGEVVGNAAVICAERECAPRDIFTRHLAELRTCLRRIKHA